MAGSAHSQKHSCIILIHRVLTTYFNTFLFAIIHGQHSTQHTKLNLHRILNYNTKPPSSDKLATLPGNGVGFRSLLWLLHADRLPCSASVNFGWWKSLRFFARSLSHLPVRPVYFIAPALGRPLLERDVSVARVVESRAKVYSTDWKMWWCFMKWT